MTKATWGGGGVYLLDISGLGLGHGTQIGQKWRQRPWKVLLTGLLSLLTESWTTGLGMATPTMYCALPHQLLIETSYRAAYNPILRHFHSDFSLCRADTKLSTSSPGVHFSLTGSYSQKLALTFSCPPKCGIKGAHLHVPPLACVQSW